MEKFPAKCANTFRSELCAVFRLLNEGSKRRQNFGQFVHVEPTFYGCVTREKSYATSFFVDNEKQLWDTKMMNPTMVVYAVFLAMGYIFRSQSIKFRTILLYLLVV